MSAETHLYDVAVIGGGPGGYVAAIRAAQLGLSVALVERAPALGGACLHWGCIPTKALLEAAHVLELARRAGEFGVGTGEVTFNWDHVQKRRQSVVETQARGIDFLMKKNKITVIAGRGELAGSGKVVVAERSGRQTEIRAKNVILATGSVPRALPSIPFQAGVVLDSDQLLVLDKVPASLIILGAGAVGMEFASIYSRFGTACTVVELLPQALPVEDADVGKEIERAFRKRKITIRTAVKAEGAEIKAGKVHLRVVPAGGEGKVETLSAEKLLIAVGRAPAAEKLGLASVDLAVADGFIPVDARLRTSREGIYAIGDIVRIEGRRHPMLAHVASHEGIVAAETIAGAPTRPLDYDRVPSVTYCDPEVASIGLTEAEARRRGHEIKTARFPMTASGRARISGETDGFVEIIAEARYDEVLGVHIVGPRATELIAEAGVALGLEATSEELFRTIHAHPTLSESIGEAAHGIHGSYIHL